MVCPQCRGIETFFDRREAERKLRSYRKSGPSKTTAMLLDAIKETGVAGKSLLDIGGGVGVIQHELLKAGANKAKSVEASSAYIQACKEEAAKQGHEERISYHHCDFADASQELEQVHIVTLDRVICCYHDVEKLVGASSSLATEVYGLVYPRDNLAMKLAFRFFNLALWLRRSPFRIFIHPDAVVDSQIRTNGLQRRFHRKTLLWQVMVYGN